MGQPNTRIITTTVQLNYAVWINIFVVIVPNINTERERKREIREQLLLLLLDVVVTKTIVIFSSGRQ